MNNEREIKDEQGKKSVREAVFAALREKGIKAIKVVAADGSKANGEIRGVRKRVLCHSWCSRRAVQRQEEEIAYYNRAKAEIENAQKSKMPAAQLNDLWEKRNEPLRQMGVKLVPMP